MNYKEILKNLDRQNQDISVRRYALSDMISESYKTLYSCKKDSNLQKLAEAHLEDVRSNPTDIDRLSRQLCLIKSLKHVDDDTLIAPIKESRRHVRGKKSTKIEESIHQSPVDEAEEPELTDEELEELTKHLETIRKERKNPAKKEDVTEAEEPKRKGIRCTTHSKKEDIEESADSEDRVFQISFDFIAPADFYTDEIVSMVSDDLEQAGYEVVGTSQKYSWSKKEYGLKESDKKECVKESYDDYGVTTSDLRSVIDLLHEIIEEMNARGLESLPVSANTYGLYGKYISFPSKGFLELTDVYDLFGDEEYEEEYESKKVKESASISYKGLKKFSQKSSSKAFYKTFKKMHESLKEGKALTRQESMTLYKAANSAMTQLSVELEHNPDFLKTFNECTTILSADVSKLLESMKSGKAPSKKTMKSLAKFSEALLREADEEEDEEEVELPAEEEETPEEEPAEAEDFVGDDEGDIQSEEEEEFDQEYADKREEIYQELADEHAASEDAGVQDKLEQERVEVAVLQGEDPDEYGLEDQGEESAAEEETPEESEEEDDSVDTEDGDEITDEELAELKKHLKEMREAKKRK